MATKSICTYFSIHFTLVVLNFCSHIKVLGRPFYIILLRITYDPFCSIEIKITTFDGLGLAFVYRCIVVKDVSVKEGHFSDNPMLPSDAKFSILGFDRLLYRCHNGHSDVRILFCDHCMCSCKVCLWTKSSSCWPYLSKFLHEEKSR